MDKLISADSLWMTIIRAMDYCEDILEFIEKEPEAIVRCKDCKFTNECLLYLGTGNLNGYCMQGERREDAETN